MFEAQIQTIMTKTLISVNRSTTVHQIAKMMEQGGIGAIIVKDQNPVGIITDRDYAIKIVANNLEHNTSVERVMSSPLITISATESILAAAKLMTAKKIRKLAVTQNGTIVGIVTSTDIVTFLAQCSDTDD